jgi:hypothetical protein
MRPSIAIGDRSPSTSTAPSSGRATATTCGQSTRRSYHGYASGFLEMQVDVRVAAGTQS